MSWLRSLVPMLLIGLLLIVLSGCQKGNSTSGSTRISPKTSTRDLRALQEEQQKAVSRVTPGTKPQGNTPVTPGQKVTGLRQGAPPPTKEDMPANLPPELKKRIESGKVGTNPPGLK